MSDEGAGEVSQIEGQEGCRSDDVGSQGFVCLQNDTEGNSAELPLWMRPLSDEEYERERQEMYRQLRNHNLALNGEELEARPEEPHPEGCGERRPSYVDFLKAEDLWPRPGESLPAFGRRLRRGEVERRIGPALPEHEIYRQLLRGGERLRGNRTPDGDC